MSDSLPGGAKVPVTFVAGQPLTEQELNTLQRELLRLLLTHSHGGNDLAVPQGEPITRDGIANDAVHGNHIAGNAITKGHISHGAIGGSEIGQQQVGQEHLTDSAVVTRIIEKGNVTLEKLSDEVQVLLKAPREGASTYGYFAWLNGKLAFPGTTQWFDWLVDPKVPVRVHDLPIVRLRDDGGWQPIDVILPPDQIRSRLTDGIRKSSIIASDEIAIPVHDEIAIPVRDGIATPVSDEITTPATPVAAGVRTLRGTAAARLTTTDAVAAKTVAPLSSRVTASISAIADPVTRVLIDKRFRLPIPVDTPATLNIVPTDDLIERNRVAMEVNPQEVGWDVSMPGRAVFHPGIGSNLVFSDGKEPVTFHPDRQPSDQELQMIDQILYNFDITDISPATLLGVGKPKIYDFLNNPHLLPAGYWTGATRNVRSVTRMRGGMGPIVRVSFAVPYVAADYVVNVTAEHSGTAVVGLIPLVMARSTEFVDIAFVTTQNVVNNKANFSVIIHGELSKS